MIWQERTGYEFQAITAGNDQHAFINDEYIYGVRARVNAFLSKQAYLNRRSRVLAAWGVISRAFQQYGS